MTPSIAPLGFAELPVDDPAPPGPPGAADAGDSARFSELMDADDPAAGAVPATAPAGAPTLGDNILGGLQRLSSDLQQTWAKVGGALDAKGAAPSVRDLLTVQMQMSTM
jgi:hypothetical protein